MTTSHQTPYELVRSIFEFPFELRPRQVEAVNYHCQFNRTGFYWDPGTGKTAGSTHWALHRSIVDGIEHWLVVMPPILIPQWRAWINSIKYKGGRNLTATEYVGDPEKRLANKDLDADFILMSYQILKRDFESLAAHFQYKPMGVIADEGHAAKNMDSANYQAIRDASEDAPLAILTGSPTTTPLDAYTYIKFIAPGIYRNMRHFEKTHVVGKDDYDKVTDWKNLDLLKANMQVQTTRLLKREVLTTDEPNYIPLFYDLDPAHYKLYRRIAEERLVEFEDGTEINAISVPKLRSVLAQAIINWDAFDSTPMKKEPEALRITRNVLDSISGKLVVSANFTKTNHYMMDKLSTYGAVAAFGDIPDGQKQRNIQRFKEDPKCRVFLLHPESAGYGLDGLQHVCSEMLFLEAPTVARAFHQVVARIDRDGQKEPVNVRVAVANRTLQVRGFKQLLSNDEIVNDTVGGYKDLKEMIYGG